MGALLSSTMTRLNSEQILLLRKAFLSGCLMDRKSQFARELGVGDMDAQWGSEPRNIMTATSSDRFDAIMKAWQDVKNNEANKENMLEALKELGPTTNTLRTKIEKASEDNDCQHQEEI